MSATETLNITFAPLETIDLARLERRDATEVDKLLRAASKAGAFFLDFRNVPNEAAKHLPEDVPKLIDISDEYFAQPLAEKMKDFREGQLPDRDRGYVPSRPAQLRFLWIQSPDQHAVKASRRRATARRRSR